MKKYVLWIVIGCINCFCFSCSKDKPHEYENLATLDFGEGVYRPNPFKILDNLPPFSWLGMPDSVKMETELAIQFNEDAIRSHSSGKLMFLDSNGNKNSGIHIGSPSTNSHIIFSEHGQVIVPIIYTVNPSVGDTILSGSIAVIGTDLDMVNDTELTSIVNPIANWTLKHRIGINWVRWIILVLIVVVIILILYGLLLTILKCINCVGAISDLKSNNKVRNTKSFLSKEQKKYIVEEASLQKKDTYKQRTNKLIDIAKRVGHIDEDGVRVLQKLTTEKELDYNDVFSITREIITEKENPDSDQILSVKTLINSIANVDNKVSSIIKDIKRGDISRLVEIWDEVSDTDDPNDSVENNKLKESYEEKIAKLKEYRVQQRTQAISSIAIPGSLYEAVGLLVYVFFQANAQHEEEENKAWLHLQKDIYNKVIDMSQDDTIIIQYIETLKPIIS